MDDKEIDLGNITIDLGNTLDSGNTIDTITLNTGYDSIGSMDMASYTTYTLPSTTATSSYTVSNGTWNTMPYITSTGSSNGISVSGDADITGSLRVGGKDVAKSLEAIERRLAILVPDPKKLEQYEALQKAYKHYKMLEALCEERTDDESKWRRHWVYKET